jgi:uncharacterized protein
MIPHTALLNEARTAIKNIYGDRLAKIILYGSYARGEQTEESDIDLLVVLNDAVVDAGEEISIMNNYFYPMSLKYNIDISARPVTKTIFDDERGFFLKRVKKEGREL